MDDLLRELEVELGRGIHPCDVDRISLRTRPAKSHLAAVTLVDEWRQRAATLGLDANSIETLCAHTLMIQTPASEVAFASLAGPGGICAAGSVFSRTEAIVAMANQPVPRRHGDPQPLLVGAERLETMVDGFLASQHVLQVTRGAESMFTTVEMLGVQDRIVTRFTKGLHRGASLVPDDHVAAAIAKHSHLTDEPRNLVRVWYGQGHRYKAAIGRAGAGKTTTVAACADAWTAAGHRVIGTAVKGKPHAPSLRRPRSSARPSPGTWPTTTPRTSPSTPAPSS